MSEQEFHDILPRISTLQDARLKATEATVTLFTMKQDDTDTTHVDAQRMMDWILGEYKPKGD